jgi:hypothetical protein
MAAGVVVLLVIHGGRELRLRWACERAREALLAAEIGNEAPPAGLEGLLSSNETSFSVFARLLAADDPVVWARAVEVLDGWHEGGRKPQWDHPSPVQLALRDANPVAWVKYQLPPAYQHHTDWRNAGYFLHPEYWSGHPEKPLAPDPRLMDYLRGFLAGKDERAFRPGASTFLDPEYRLDHERRAVYALRAMLPTRPPPTVAVELLRWTVAEHRHPAVQLVALSALTLAESPFGEDPSCVAKLQWDLESPPACENRLHFLAAGDDKGEAAVPFHADHHLELLAHLDSAWALWVLVRLHAKSDLSDVVARALGPERGRWPIEKPTWLPLEAAAARYLASSSLDERAAALLALVDIGTADARETLAAHEAREPHAELRLLARSGLAALGEERHRATVEPELGSRFDAQDRKWRELGSPPTVFAAPRWPWCAEGPGGGWVEPYRIESTHLARHLLLAGSRATLDRLVERYLEWDACPLELTRHVDGLPLSPWSEEPRDPSEITLLIFAEREEEQRQLGEWWEANADKLLWDARERKFVADGRHGAR